MHSFDVKGFFHKKREKVKSPPSPLFVKEGELERLSLISFYAKSTIIPMRSENLLYLISGFRQGEKLLLKI